MVHEVDALVVGGGFGGIYLLHKLRQLGLTLKLIDNAPKVGGTWYRNRYPGANSDTLSEVYRFSWDKEDLLSYPWKNKFVSQGETLAYLKHVVSRHDLGKYMQFHTEMEEASFEDNAWTVKLSTGESYRARYLVTALGAYSKPLKPNIPGIESFSGEMYHTSEWPESFDFKNKRVGVIGNGSSGVQVMTALAPQVKQLLSFQRHPQYVVPNGDGPITPEYRDNINKNWDKIRNGVRTSASAHNNPETTVYSSFSVSDDERERLFEDIWQRGTNFAYMFGAYGDIVIDKKANEELCKFFRRKIAGTVKDPKKAYKLQPRDLYDKRPICALGYYEIFNQDHVDIIDLRDQPPMEIVPEGIKTADGVHELDVIVLATGFEIFDGNYNRISIKGRDQKSLRDRWAASGSSSYLGVAVPGFPNMFTVAGPRLPLANVPATIEAQGDFISSIIAKAESERKVSSGANAGPVIEVTQEAEDGWVTKVDEVGKSTVFYNSNSYLAGVNIPGRPRSMQFWVGGFNKWFSTLQDELNGGFENFNPFF